MTITKCDNCGKIEKERDMHYLAGAQFAPLGFMKITIEQYDINWGKTKKEILHFCGSCAVEVRGMLAREDVEAV